MESQEERDFAEVNKASKEIMDILQGMDSALRFTTFDKVGSDLRLRDSLRWARKTPNTLACNTPVGSVSPN